MQIARNNPIMDKISLLVPIKSISIAVPDAPGTAIMMQVRYDAGLEMRIPELEIVDVSSADAIIEQRKAVTVTGWTGCELYTDKSTGNRQKSYNNIYQR